MTNLISGGVIGNSYLIPGTANQSLYIYISIDFLDPKFLFTDLALRFKLHASPASGPDSVPGNNNIIINNQNKEQNIMVTYLGRNLNISTIPPSQPPPPSRKTGWGSIGLNKHLRYDSTTKKYIEEVIPPTPIPIPNDFTNGSKPPGSGTNFSMQETLSNSAILMKADMVYTLTTNPYGYYVFQISNIEVSNKCPGGQFYFDWEFLKNYKANSSINQNDILAQNSIPIQIAPFSFNGQNVGINNANPLATLDVSGNVHITGVTTLDGIVGIGNSNPATKLDVSGTAHITGITTLDSNVGIGISTPATKLDVNGTAHITGVTTFDSDVIIGANKTSTSLLKFPNKILKKLISLYEDATNNHQYYGFGMNGFELNYQVANENASHVFYAGKDATTSKELARIKGGGAGNKAELKVEGRIKDQSGFIMPVGSIIAFGGSTIPDGWLLCDGRTINDIIIPVGINVSLYKDLTDAIGAKLPDLRGRFIIGTGTGIDSNRPAISQTFTLNDKSGEYQHQLTKDEMPKHDHRPLDGVGFLTGNAGGGVKGFAEGGMFGKINSTLTSISGNDNTHNNMPPYYALTYIIKY